MDILIDGYNLMHIAGLARRSYGPGDLERARLRLVGLVAKGCTAQQRQRVAVVFDAKEAPPDGSRIGTAAGVPILFARPGREADELIEELIARHSAPKRLLVVSSDHRLQRAAKRRGARYIDSDVFLEHLERRRRTIERARPVPPAEELPKRSEGMSAAELSHWLDEFKEVQLHDILREIDDELCAPRPPTGASASDREERQGAPSPPSDELEFWEKRIAELFQEDNGSLEEDY